MIDINVSTRNFQHVEGRLEQLPGDMIDAARAGMKTWAEEDYLPTLDSVLRGDMQVPEVPARNKEPYATMKEANTGIGHSLGDVPHPQHSAGLLRTVAKSFRPTFTKERNRTILNIEYPPGYPEYMYAVHEGQYGRTQPYRFVTGAFNKAKDKILDKIMMQISRLSW